MRADDRRSLGDRSAGERIDRPPDMIADVPPHVDLARRARFERLFADVYAPLQRFVRRRADAAAVDDVVAETLLILWRRLDDVPAEAELAWCYGTARRCLANTWRADERRNRLARRVASQPATVDDAGAETDAELVAALDELSGDDREIVRLWAWEQLAPREIAVVLAISPNAASIRLHRAKQRLAARLGSRKDGATAGHNPAGDHVGRTEEGA
jgi:RNA polymerase sigma-70 factor, ECF subfamily